MRSVTPAELGGMNKAAVVIGPFGSSLKTSDFRVQGVPLIFVRDIRTGDFSTPRAFVSAEKARELKAHLAHPGDLVVTKMGDPPGDVAIYDGPVPAVITADCIRLRPTDDFDTRYLLHAFRTQQVRQQVLDITSGAAQKKVSLERFRTRVAVPVPSLSEQRRIAAILDHADALRAKRRQVLTHLDALSQSIFTEMFSAGDFDSVTAGALMPKMRNGLSPATDGTCEAKVLTLGSVTRGLFDPTAVKPGAFAIEPPAEKRITDRDFLMCRGNGNKALVGVGTYSRENRPELVFPDTVIAGTVNTKLVTMPFLEAAWKRRDVRVQIEAVARTTNGTYKVNQQTLSGVLVPVPPLDLQKAFDAKVNYLTQQRAAVQRASAVDDELFTSLEARAFRGEL